MNSFIEFLNLWGDRFIQFALPMLIQSSLLIVFLIALDLLLRKRVRAVFRYGLWMLVLIKLILPPTFASPTGLGYWLTLKQPDKPVIAPAPVQVTVSYSEAEPIYIPSITPLAPPKPTLAWPAMFLLGWASVAFGLIVWLVLRARFVARMSARANDAPESLRELLESCRRQLKINRPLRLKLSLDATSPAVCGLWRPTILIPAQLEAKLSALPMRAVLLHELAHIKRGDLWVNCAQTLLQIFYWYNPLLWLANAVIRRVREQAVDEMVMVEMGQEADAYPATLLEVAKLTFTRSVLSLGLVGIMESKSALRERIDRIMDFRPPRKTGLTFTSALCVLAVGALAVPMGKAPPPVPVATNLIRREYRVDKLTFAKNLIKRGGLSEIRISSGDFGRSRNRNAYDGPLVSSRPNSLENQKSIQGALRRVLADAGVETQPTEIDMWLFTSGEVWVQTTPEKLPAIERVLVELNGAPLQDGSRLLSPVPLPGDLPLVTAQKSNAVSAPNTEATATDLYTGTNIKDKVPVLGDLRLFGRFFRSESAIQQLATNAPARKDKVPLLGDLPLVATQKTTTNSAQWPPVTANPYTRTNLIRTGKGRQAILSKLDQIRFDEVHFEGVPLSKVVETLAIESKNRAPDKRGVSFIINPHTDIQSTGGIDPTTGLPTTVVEQVDIGSVIIRINPPLQDVRLADVLDAIVKVADKPIKYSIEDYAIVFSLKKGEETPPLYTRFFRVETNTFFTNLRKQTGLSETSSSEEKQLTVRKFFTNAGVDLEPPKNIFLNDRHGMLMVRATLQDLDIVERAMQTLNIAQLQIMIVARFIEVAEKAAVEFWKTVGGTSIANGTRTAVLTSSKNTVVLSALEESGSQLLGASKVTTISGMKTHISSEQQTKIEGAQVMVGQSCDLVAEVATNGFTVKLTAETEIKDVPFSNGNPSKLVHARKLSGKAVLYDHQTLVLGSPTDDQGRSSESPNDGKKRLLVFLTLHIVDPAGNEIHTGRNLPFPADQIPPQRFE
ncbi:MAG: hypothetical protein HY298_02410 [Verrucomicrobia bacterium]|nr:hypothetical protein [Verrucomicrobiota bacterium]